MKEKCKYLHEKFNKIPKIGFPFDETNIFLNGIYILFENGEYAHGTDRIVRIGTHTGDDKLPARLREHFITENKDRSIFRKNIGRALLMKNNDLFLKQWELDLTKKEDKDKYSGLVDFAKQKDVERKVTKYIQQQFQIVVFEVKDRKKRLELESKLIATISHCSECGPSDNWLGQYSPKTKIRESGLWQTQHLYGQPLFDNDIKIFD